MSPRRNPFDELLKNLEEMMNNMPVQDEITPRRLGLRGNLTEQNNRADNLYLSQETDGDSLVVTMDVPGSKEEDIDIQVKNTEGQQHLVVKSKVSAGSRDETRRTKVRLNERVVPDEGQARYNNGVLTVEFTLDETRDGDTVPVDF